MELKMLIQILASVLIITGCGQKNESLFQDIRPEKITTVVFGEFDDEYVHYLTNAAGEFLSSTGEADIVYYWKEVPIKEYFRVTDPTVIADLWSRLTPVPTNNEPDASITFSGVLSHQFFLDSATNVIATTMVVCFDSQVIAARRERSFVRNGNLCILATIPTDSAALHRPAYCRSVIDLMWSNAPNKVAQYEDFQKQVGTTLENVFFTRPDDKQYMRTNLIYQVPDTNKINRLTEQLLKMQEKLKD